MIISCGKRLKMLGLFFCVLNGLPSISWANGNLALDTGIRNGAMGGAGAAFTTDPSGLAINPALGTSIPNAATLGFFLLNLTNEVNGFGANIPVKQSNAYREVPIISLAYNYHIKENLSFGISSSGAGGGTIFHASPFMPNTLHPNTLAYTAALMEASLTYSPTKSLALGAGSILGYLTARTDASMQSPWEPTDNALGIGGIFGAKFDFNQQFSVGASLQTPVVFQKLYSYTDVVKNNIQLPMITTVGVVWHILPVTDVLFDVQRAFWSNTSSAGKSPSVPGAAGWKSRNTYRLGAQRQVSEKIVLRAGYNHSPVVIEANNVFPANVFSPGNVLQVDSIFAGGSYQAYQTLAFDFMAGYAFENSMTDNGKGFGGPAAKGYNIKGTVPVTVGFGVNWHY